MTKLAAVAALCSLFAAAPASAQDAASAMKGNCMMEQLQKACGPMNSPEFKACAKTKSQEAAMACQGEAHARGYKKAHDELIKDSPCMDDSKKYCAGKFPGSPEYSACMKAHESQLTPECVAYGKKRSHMGPAKDGACGADARKFCSESGPGTPGFMPCMMKHHDELSPACQAMFKGMHKRP